MQIAARRLFASISCTGKYFASCDNIILSSHQFFTLRLTAHLVNTDNYSYIRNILKCEMIFLIQAAMRKILKYM